MCMTCSFEVKKDETIDRTFHENVKESNKVWVDKSNEFYNRSLKSWLYCNDVVIYSTHHEGKSIPAERFIRKKIYKEKKKAKKKIYKDMASQSRNVYVDGLPEVVKQIHQDCSYVNQNETYWCLK